MEANSPTSKEQKRNNEPTWSGCAENSPLGLRTSISSSVVRETQFPPIPRLKTSDSFVETVGGSHSDSDRTRKAESTVSQWAKHKKLCCGSIAHLWAWTIGFVSLVTSGIIIWAELRHN